MTLDRAQAEKPRLAEIADRAAQWFLLFSLITRATIGQAGGEKPPLLPGFAVGFVVLAAINSSGWLPPALPACS